MKPMLRFSIAAVTVGMCFLMFRGETRNDAVAAQGSKPVTMYRVYTRKDGLSHAEKIELKNLDPQNIANLIQTPTEAALRKSTPDPPATDYQSCHPPPPRQYIF